MQNNAAMRRTQPLRPSKIGLFLSCPLRYLFETERSAYLSLPPGPQVYLGIAFHGAIEHFWGQPSIKGLEIREWIRTEFGKKITEADRNLCQWLYVREGIDGVIAPSIVNDASRLAHQQVAASKSGSKRVVSPNAKEISQSIFGIERRLTSETLDLAGRADLIEMDGECVCVVDFKLGLHLTVLGEPSPEYLLQLASYALIVREQLGDVSVSLELRSPKRTSRHAFDHSLESSVLETIQVMRAKLPRDTVLDTAAIAQSGEHCLSCGHRHLCTNYQNRLKATSCAGTEFVSPNDVRGTVISVSEERGIFSVILQANPDSRRVSISGIPAELLDGQLKVGDVLAAFSLATPEVRGKGNYIANFHIWDQTNPRQSAFNCKIFTGESLPDGHAPAD